MPAPRPTLAILLIVASSMLLAATTLFAKALGTDTTGPALHPLQISHGRFIFAFLALGLASTILRPTFSSPHWGLHLARTSCGAAGVTLMFAAVAYIPLSDATAITFLNPVFAMMLAIPLLGERVGRVRWSAAALALAGAMVLLRPTPDSFQAASLLALAAAMVMGLELIFIKKLSGREAAFQILLVNNLIGVTITSVAVIPVWQAPTLAQWGLLAVLGACMACAQALFVNAMARADASFIAPFSYATLIFATLYDFTIFGAVPDAASWIGASIILSGGLWLALRERHLQRKRLQQFEAICVQRL